MCDNNLAWVFNLLVVALLIHHAVCVVHAAEQEAAGSPLVKRDVVPNANDGGNGVLATRNNGHMEVDFAAYMNDFNMQDETSIPEDILDQQHIRDEDTEIDADMQYVETEPADIILESEKDTSKNFSTYELRNKNKNKKQNNNKNNNKNHYIRHPNEKDILRADAATVNNNDDQKYDGENNVADEIAAQSIYSGTAGNKKFKVMLGQTSQQQTQEQQEQQVVRDPLDVIEKLNERKFNKPPEARTFSTGDEDDTAEKTDSNNNVNNKAKSSSTENNIKKDVNQAAIGDIEDNFRNEDGALEDMESITGKDELAAAPEGVEERLLGSVEVEAGAIADRTDNKLSTIFVARKNKRHFGPRVHHHSNRKQRKHEQEQQKADYFEQDQGVPMEQQQQSTEAKEQLSAQTDYPNSYFGLASNETTAFDTERWVPYDNVDEVDMPRTQHHGAERDHSAFERHKTQRRNNRRSGHKSHKKKYKDYLRYTVTTMANGSIMASANWQSAEAVNATITSPINSTDGSQHQHMDKLKKHRKKIEAEKIRVLPASPIFVVAANRNAGEEDRAEKPFYEGQINYYVETRDEDEEKDNLAQRIRNEDNSWYRRSSPVLRNGIKTTNTEGKQQEQHESHTHRQQQPQHHHRNHHKHHQHGKHYQSTQQNPYQRKLMPLSKKTTHNSSAANAALAALPASRPVGENPYPHARTNPTHSHTEDEARVPPAKDAMRELGHQITEMEDFERYYAKWPHLASVKFQMYDEHYREENPDMNQEYPEYDSVAEMEESLKEDDEYANLPPYIKKYKRRNKQLLDLLEGTLPPTSFRSWSKSQRHDGSGHHEPATELRIDGEYMLAKRRRHQYLYGKGNVYPKNYHQDIFKQQRSEAEQGTTTSTPSSVEREPQTPPPHNHLPDEDVSVSQEHNDESWQKEMESKSSADELPGSKQMTWQIEKLTTAVPTLAAEATPPSTTTPKAAIFRLPSYPAFAGNFMNKPRSRSAQFAPSGGNRVNSFISSTSAGGGAGGQSSNNFNLDTKKATSTAAPPPTPPSSPPATSAPSRSFNSFVYHRVVDNSPRVVGAGLTGRKQRLPFVAITDRRVETSKKASSERQKDLEQNDFPMP